MKIFLLDSAEEKTKLKLWEYLKKLEGQYVVQVGENFPMRSLGANRRYWFVLKIMSLETGTDSYSLHEEMKIRFNKVITFDDEGNGTVKGGSTTIMTTAEFAHYLENVTHFGREDLGCIIPDSRDIDYKMWLEVDENYKRMFS